VDVDVDVDVLAVGRSTESDGGGQLEVPEVLEMQALAWAKA
jgi:hypothetical protein